MKMNQFKEWFPKSHRPEITELEEFWGGSGAAALFRDFAAHILNQYDLRFGIPVWSEKNGWTYRIGKSGVYIINGIVIGGEGFTVDGIEVKDAAGYSVLLEHIQNVYEEKNCELQDKIKEKNLRQADREKKRRKRERVEREALEDRIIPEKYNVFHWPSKLDIQKLRQLYLLDAKGIQNTELADEIGLSLYLRCKYGKEDMEHMERYAIRCHHCGAELEGGGDFRQCACGYQYSYKEYRRSYRRNNMPTGAAAKVFEAFITNWELAKSYNEKILLIDSLLHEFHLSLVSGAVHRPVAMNFIEGTQEKVTSVINSLAQDR